MSASSGTAPLAVSLQATGACASISSTSSTQGPRPTCIMIAAVSARVLTSSDRRAAKRVVMQTFNRSHGARRRDGLGIAVVGIGRASYVTGQVLAVDARWTGDGRPDETYGTDHSRMPVFGSRHKATSRNRQSRTSEYSLERHQPETRACQDRVGPLLTTTKLEWITDSPQRSRTR